MGLTLALGWLLAVNLAAFLAFWRDKDSARRGRRRVPERVLLTLALVGGSLGAVAGQHLLRHKTRKQPFGAWLRLIVFLQAIAVVAPLAIAAANASPA
jgi:uncharacterized membrane protein YsdA (DUF1294 family)